MIDQPSYDIAGPAILIVADEGASDRLASAVAVTSGRMAARIAWNALASSDVVYDVIVAEAGGVAMDRLAAALPVLDAMQAGAASIIAFEEHQIDIVAAAMLGTDAILLCSPDATGCASALALALSTVDRAAPSSFVQEGEAARLERLNAEVARIAETLARLTRGDEAPDRVQPLALADRSLGFGAQPPATEPVRAADVRRAIRVRRLRDAVFGAGLFEDPAWDMMLDLFAAELERAQVSVSSLCIAAAVAPTTALRWISRLTDAGLLVREPDPFDKRRAFMALAPQATAAMREYWAAAIRAGAVSG